MSTTFRALPPCPWKSTFLAHLSNLTSPEFTLATLAQTSKGSPIPYLPRARTCIFRGMWAELPANAKNKANMNPKVFESECPTFTTDVRMEKVEQLFSSSPGKDGLSQQNESAAEESSGGGGPVEAVFWISETSTQWRIKGRAWVVGPDIENEDQLQTSGVRTVKSEIGKRMRITEKGKGKEGEWSWMKELTAHFGNMSPGARGMFRQPPPGQPVSAVYDKEHQMGTTVEDLDDRLARKYFRVVIIRPEEVEATDLSDPNKARRRRYSFEEETGEWTNEELWP
ncbi:hypothetical protein M501DRAFT_1001186 [Patellaria atrata CBS 101060]|uniref:Pyridoxamine 5'-phosphate oxidase Alr4036 family FMN-binding domain-containing protein n=1 Tax=Patellaria atrata CBS 101060 TaxID=1346257 RepID=A0A9P4S1B2_9PEZI|nr:hypothetical protein M501DRAFT_1001186 [Patellaria atrata CBS 101060]